MSRHSANPPQPVHVRLTPLFEATWYYEELVRLMPFGAASEGQAFAYSQSARVEGDQLSGAYRMVQYLAGAPTTFTSLTPMGSSKPTTSAGESPGSH